MKKGKKKAKLIGMGSTFEDWAVVDGKYHHIAVVWPKEGWPELYIDGEYPRRASDYAVYDQALTGKELRKHYLKRTSASYADTIRANNPIYYSGDDPAWEEIK